MIGVLGAAGCAPAPPEAVLEPRTLTTVPASAMPPLSLPTATATSVATSVPTEMASSTTAPSATAAPIGAMAKPASTKGMALLPGGAYSTRQTYKAIKLQPFWVDITEVTVEAYRSCVTAGKCTDEGLGCGDFPTYGVAGKDNYPVNCVDRGQATAYCASLGKRLPAVEELEWAARGAARAASYPWGEDAPVKQPCWRRFGTGESKGKGPCPVRAFPAGTTAEGIADLSGNVGEWTTGANPGSVEVHGGSWRDAVPELMEASCDVLLPAKTHWDTIGFRCVYTAQSP
ncbi:MAG: formylglycine-generating enzyme family protein [Minicystis sp.]